jgi:hypothetical protein
MRNAKRWILIAAIAAIPFATANCAIPLVNGCTYEINQVHAATVPDNNFDGLKIVTWYNTGLVC